MTPAPETLYEAEMPEAHLTSDMMHVDVEGHRQHRVYDLQCNTVRPGVVTLAFAVCSCGVRFKLRSGPKGAPT